jgi:membrane dipeptidase
MKVTFSVALLFLVAAFAFLQAPGEAAPRANEPTPQLVIDAHVDPGWRILDFQQSLAEPDDGQVGIPQWRAGGLTVVWVAIWVDPRRYAGPEALRRADALIDAVTADISRNSKDLVLCRTSRECLAAAQRRKIAILLGLEGGEPLLNSPEMVDYFWRKGVRRITLTWRGDMAWAGSSQQWDQTPVRSPKGLSDLGRRIIERMNMRGIVVDLSHTSELTAHQALEISRYPCIFSHSNCSALCQHPRNVSDDLLKQLAANGGVIGVNFHSKFLVRRSPFSLRAASIEDVVEHIEHIRKVAGIDHVGIGSDWDGDILPARGLEDASKLPSLWQALRNRGYSPEDISKIAGGNFFRVLQANEAELSR